MRAIPAFAVLASVALAEALPPFVVLSKARSGTTWFLELLRQHPQVRVEGEILFGASTSAEATARLEAFGREKRRGAAHVAVGFKLLDSQGGEALRDGAGNGTVAAWLERRRAKLLVLEREGLARLVSMRKHEAAVRDFDALLAAGALRSKNEKYKCFSADCVDRARARAVTLDASRVVRDLDREYDAWTQLLAWVRRYTFADVQYHAYRDLSRDPKCEMTRVFSFLGVPRFRVAANESTLKMGAAMPRLDVANAADVEAALAGTRWDGELDRRFA